MNALRNRTLLAKYRAGLDELVFSNRRLGMLATSMGMPVFSTDLPTAWVTYDLDGDRVVFSFNPDFLMTLTDEQCAAVIAHECHHIALDHLDEITDKAYTNHSALINAQECIINDTLVTVHSMDLIDGVLRGPDLINTDCTPLSTRQAYDLFNQQDEEQDQDQDQDGEKEQDKDQNSGDSSDSGQSTPQEPDSQDDSQEQGKGDQDQDGKGQEDEDSDQGGSGGKGQDADGEGDQAGQSGNPAHGHGCGGVIVPEGFEDAMKTAMDDFMEKAAQDQGKSRQEMEAELSNSSAPSFNAGGAMTDPTLANMSNERMNWRNLLAKINPKVKEAGRPRAKVRNNWTKPNRRMVSVYPQVVLPVSERVNPKKADKGDELPVFVIALDLSGSIDKTLVRMLQGLLEDIPEKLIKAYPCTWSDTCVPFENRRVVRSNGTNIDSVVTYVKKIQQETGEDPYVLVITDGEYYCPTNLPGKKWFYMGVNDASVRTIKKGYGGIKFVEAGEEVYNVRDFRS